MNETKTVLLTGVTGFLGSHTAIQLLQKGYHVVGTLRSMARAESIKNIIAEHTSRVDNLRFAEADLLDAAVWPSLMAGIDYVQHVASPFPRSLPKTEEELIKPAKQGTLHVLKAAAEAGVKRVVLTSSSGSIAYGKPKGGRSATFTEKDWTDTSNLKDTTPYIRSKTLAERAAWEFIEQDTSGMELTTVCPGAILGPILEQDFGTSANMVVKTMDGSSPAIPKIAFNIIDVRSVAEILIRAMETPAAAGQRYTAAEGFMSFKDIAMTLREAYPERKGIPSRGLPNFMTRLIALFEPSLKAILFNLDVERRIDFSKTMKELNWQPKPTKDAVLATAESLIRLGVVKA